MAVRRLARQGLQWAEQQPVASTSQLQAKGCPGCRRALSHAVPLAPGTVQASQTAPAQGNGPHRQTAPATGGWAALSRAGHALFGPPSSSSPPSPPAQLTGAAADLVQELKRKRPDPHRVWDLFTQVDLDGRATSLPLPALYALLPALHTPPPAHRTVQSVTAAARAYQTKADLVRLRCAQAGARPTRAQYAALVAQFHALRYAPGAVKAWDEARDAGCEMLRPKACRSAFDALLGWVELHGRAAGRAVERACAVPLARKAEEMLFDDIGLADTKRVDAVVEPFFRLVVKAGDLPLFKRAFKALYGFDVALPGALLDVSSAQRARLRTIGEDEVCWILDALAEANDLPGLIAAFETFDQPDAPAPTTFFTPGGTDLAAPATSEGDAHLVGTRAFTIIIQAASRLGNATIARHYFDLLFMRWTGDTEKRIAEMESAVGIVPPEVEKPDEWVEELDAGASALPAEVIALANGSTPPTEGDVASPTGPPAHNDAEVSTSPSIARSVSITSRFGMHLTPAPSAPARPYAVPSTLIARIAHDAKMAYDAPMAWWLRRRTKRILQQMEAHLARITAVLDALAPVPVPASASADAEVGPAAPEPQSVALLRREVALAAFHREQLRLTLVSVKADSRILAAYKTLHVRQATLALRARRLANPALGKRDVVRLRPGVRRKAHQVLLSHMALARNRIRKLREIDGQRTGAYEHDLWVARYRALKAAAFPSMQLSPAPTVAAEPETAPVQP
ncbi:hypothetical protein JCM3770_003047 [Rhodotorula araucariae]